MVFSVVREADVEGMEIDGPCEKRSEKPTRAVEIIIITGFMDCAKRADAINAFSSLKL